MTETKRSPWITNAQIDNWTAYHPPKDQTIIDAHEAIRRGFNDLMKRMNKILPEGPDKTRAMNTVRDGMMLSNAAIACAQTAFPLFVIEKDGPDTTSLQCEQCGGRLTTDPSAVSGTYIFFVDRLGVYVRHLDQMLALDHMPVL